MRNLICVLLVVLLPLTLASQTQHRFKVHVIVEGEDATINSVISSHVKRELRALGDVDIVGESNDWRFLILISYLELKTEGGRKNGQLAIANVAHLRVSEHHLIGFDNISSSWFEPVYPGSLGVAYWSRDNLHKWCITMAGEFNDTRLEFARRGK